MELKSEVKLEPDFDTGLKSEIELEPDLDIVNDGIEVSGKHQSYR